MDVANKSAAAGAAFVSAVVEYNYTAIEPDELDLVKGAIIHNVKQMSGGWWEGTLQSNGKTGMFPDNFVRIIDVNDENSVVLREKSATTNRRCKVIYSYTQVNDDELSLAVGDVIEFLGEVEEGWWRGRLKNKIGVFPSNFVVAIEPSPILASKRPPSVATTSAAVATTTRVAATAATAANITAASTITPTASTTSTTTTTTKKMNRLSFHSSKEDLLSSKNSSISSSSATATDDIAPSLPPKPQREYCRVEYPYAPQNDDELELKVGDIITIISTELPDKGWWKGELRGKVGVYPDNFVKMLAPAEVSPLSEPQHSHRTVKTAAATSSNLNVTSATSTTSTLAASTVPSSKVFIKKSGSTSSTQSSNRKDSFGSRDSLNDILSETGLQSGNVAAQRKSLENKNFDLSNAPDSNSRLALKKQQESKTLTTTTISSSVMLTSNSSSANDLRKSLENMDEKTKTTPPPVLTKKPSVPNKKNPTVTSVAGNLLSGLKQKVKSVENKLTTAASHDYADGVGSSKMSHGGLPDSGPSGNVVMRRAATIAVEDTDFDHVERASILSDMRAGRVKAPKRRPPSAAINVIGESNNNNSVYLNGSSTGCSELLQAEDGKPQSSDDNSTGEEQLAKPKPREWEKKKAPWMEELKASQVKKKTSPNVEPRSAVATGATSGSVADRTSRLLGDDIKITNSSHSATTSSTNNTAASHMSSSSITSSSTTTKVQSSSISSSVMQQSMTVESSSSSSTADAITKSMNAKLANDTEDVRMRPNSLSIRNRSTSPSAMASTRSALKMSSASPATVATAAVSGSATETTTTSTNSTMNSSNSASTSTAAKTTTTIVNNHQQYHYENNIPSSSLAGKQQPATATVNNAADNSNSSNNNSMRVVELERRVEKLEAVVHSQQRTIDELVRTLREETDRVKVLRGELDKYAQCVTQV